MKKHLLALALLTPFTASASGLHLSPEIKMGPYLGSGISGGGLQLGVTDVLGLDALYVSYSHTSAEILLDKDRLKTYRVGGQYQFLDHPMKMALQLEGGVVEYEGKRDYVFSNTTRYEEGTGASISASWVLFINDNVGFRLGTDFNYIDKSDTLLESNWSATISSGIVLHF
ncbi:hypothetical protein [Vibrio sp. TBV020]|uniref:hypothetical protein n=1 Tax=Vibrio sp. TBV020 TaxID=3137398 RepID=UPI0038CDB5E8